MYKQSNCHLVTVSISICQQHSQHQYILSLAIAYCSKGHEIQGNSTIIQFIKFQQYKNVFYLSFTTGVMCDTLDANDGTFPETPNKLSKGYRRRRHWLFELTRILYRRPNVQSLSPWQNFRHESFLLVF